MLKGQGCKVCTVVRVRSLQRKGLLLQEPVQDRVNLSMPRRVSIPEGALLAPAVRSPTRKQSTDRLSTGAARTALEIGIKRMDERLGSNTLDIRHPTDRSGGFFGGPHAVGRETSISQKSGVEAVRKLLGSRSRDFLSGRRERRSSGFTDLRRLLCTADVPRVRPGCP
jgi:hypothetical protein